jgi:hypothetical protein
MKYGYSDVADELKAEQKFGDLLDSGVIRSMDWHQTKGRIIRKIDEDRPSVRIE